MPGTFHLCWGLAVPRCVLRVIRHERAATAILSVSGAEILLLVVTDLGTSSLRLCPVPPSKPTWVVTDGKRRRYPITCPGPQIAHHVPMPCCGRWVIGMRAGRHYRRQRRRCRRRSLRLAGFPGRCG